MTFSRSISKPSPRYVPRLPLIDELHANNIIDSHYRAIGHPILAFCSSTPVVSQCDIFHYGLHAYGTSVTLPPSASIRQSDSTLTYINYRVSRAALSGSFALLHSSLLQLTLREEELTDLTSCREEATMQVAQPHS